MYELKTEKPKTPYATFVGFISAVGAFIFNSIEAIVTVIALLIVFYLFLFTPHEVIGHSMDPSFETGEYLIANKLVYKIGEPKRGDVIIFQYSKTRDYIKRIIGLPGEQVSLRDGHIYINGSPLDETEYLASSVYTNKDNYLDEGETITVPFDEYFVCGDNRQHSSDSRNFGPIKKDKLKAKVLLVYFPFTNFRVIHHPKYE